MGRPSNRAERRREIVAALERAMAAHGYEGATIATIAREANLAPGLIHYHFGSKQEILLALVDRIAARVDERYARREGSDSWSRLDALIDAHLALGDDADRDAVAAWVALGTEALRSAEVQRAYERIVSHQLERIQKLVVDILKQDKRSTRDAKRIAAGILSAIEGAFRLAVTAPGALPAGFAAPAVRAMARGALQA